jgi:hypothetical protein
MKRRSYFSRILSPPAGAAILRAPRPPFTRATGLAAAPRPLAPVAVIPRTADSMAPGPKIRRAGELTERAPAPPAGPLSARAPHAERPPDAALHRTLTPEVAVCSKQPAVLGAPGEPPPESVNRELLPARLQPSGPRQGRPAQPVGGRVRPPVASRAAESYRVPKINAWPSPDLAPEPRPEVRLESYKLPLIDEWLSPAPAPEPRPEVRLGPPPGRPPAPGPEPATRVEIGNIEVRLVPASRPPRRSAQTRTSRSLVRAAALPFGLRQV